MGDPSPDFGTPFDAHLKTRTPRRSRYHHTSRRLVLDSIHEGDIIQGEYKVVRILGKGGMGVVVAAQGLRLDETQADAEP